MVRKAKTNEVTKSDSTQPPSTDAQNSVFDDAENPVETITDSPTEPDQKVTTEDDKSPKQTEKSAKKDQLLEGYTIILEQGKALKLSPKTQNHVFYQIATHDEDGQLCLRINGNEGGGLHSKEWLSVEKITETLEGLTGQIIKSTMLRSIFKGGSSNNTAFLAAILRSPEIGLLVKAGDTIFSHELAPDYEQRKADLLNLAK